MQQVEDALKNEEAHRLGAAAVAAATAASSLALVLLLQLLFRPFAHSVPNLDTLLSAASSTRTTASVKGRGQGVL